MFVLIFKFCVWFLLTVALISLHDLRQSASEITIAPHRFGVVSWELANLPDKWLRRAIAFPFSIWEPPEPGHAEMQAQRYFEIGKRIQEIERQIIALEVEPRTTVKTSYEIADLRRERDDLILFLSYIRPEVEETLESAVARALKDSGFNAWTGVFPPVDTALIGSPTALILSPRERIQRIEGGLLRSGLHNDDRERIESTMEAETGWSSLVVNTGGIALYPSIVAETTRMDYALEVIAHEWVHHWLWFRPLGRRYFQNDGLTTMNETVASIAGAEIGRMALDRLEATGTLMTPRPNSYGASEIHASGDDPDSFDFQAEMRTTRIRVDELLAAGDVEGAEAYMEERRRLFVAAGYPIRKINQAYFAFHGAYATTGAAGVSVIGEQVLELRRRSPSLEQFLRTTARFTSPEELAEYLDQSGR